jgi:hypothetical protein
MFLYIYIYRARERERVRKREREGERKSVRACVYVLTRSTLRILNFFIIRGYYYLSKIWLIRFWDFKSQK